MCDFDTTNWPIVYFKVIVKNINDDTFEKYRKDYLELLVKAKRENKKMVVICDLNYVEKYETLPMKYLLKQSQFNKECYKFNKDYVTCVCILCNNKSLRTILNLYFAVTRQASPYKVCKSSEKATLYLKDKFNIDFNTSIYFDNNNLNNINETLVEEEDEELVGEPFDVIDDEHKDEINYEMVIMERENDNEINHDNNNCI